MKAKKPKHSPYCNSLKGEPCDCGRITVVVAHDLFDLPSLLPEPAKEAVKSISAR